MAWTLRFKKLAHVQEGATALGLLEMQTQTHTQT